MPQGTTGREVKGLAFAKFGTNSWGVAATVTKGGRFDSDGGIQFKPTFVEDRAYGEQFLGASGQGDLAPLDLSLTGQCRYDDHHYVLRALAMGSPAAVTISTSASGQTTTWNHVIDMAPTIDGLGITIAVDNKMYVDEVPSAKVFGFSMSGGEGGVCMETYRILGSHVASPATNTRSTIYDASFPALTNKMFKHQGVFRLNAQSGGSLVAADAVKIETFELSFERPQDSPHVYGLQYIDEPGDNDYPTASIRVTYSRMNTVSANSLEQSLRAHAAWKGDMTYTSPVLINSTEGGRFLAQFPYMELQDFSKPKSGAAQIKPTAMFVLKQAAAAPTGMTGVTKPFRLTITQQNSIHAFA
jgi:hypothetical protein